VHFEVLSEGLHADFSDSFHKTIAENGKENPVPNVLDNKSPTINDANR
jgi:hypothetical protein